MEYVQMTLDDWIQMKQKLRQELLGVKQSFVRIGYALRQIEDQQLYERDGYKSIAEFAKAEYGLEPSTTSRFMSINREYSIDGYSERLRPEFADLGRSQLEEMLKLPESDRQMIQKETSREDIRDLKRFNKTEPAAGVADDLYELVKKFYEENKDVLNAVFAETPFEEESMKRFSEIVNPGGNRSYKKGLYFLMMYENRVAVKKFGDVPKNLTWWQFYQMTLEIFGEAAAGSETWQRYFGKTDEKEPERAQEETDNAELESTGSDKLDEQQGEQSLEAEKPGESVADQTEQEDRKQRIAPAQKSLENLEEKPSDGDKNRGNFKEEKEENSKPDPLESVEEGKTDFEPMNHPEVLEKPFGSRKDYLDTLTAYGAAEYMEKCFRGMHTPGNILSAKAWESWFDQEVDDNGREIAE